MLHREGKLYAPADKATPKPREDSPRTAISITQLVEEHIPRSWIDQN